MARQHLVLGQELAAEAAHADLAAGLDPDRPLAAILPGSRRKQVRRHFPILLEALGLLRRVRPGLQAVVPRASTLPAALLEAIAGRAGQEVRILDGSYPQILAAADVGAVASDTATLDAAMEGLPAVVVYRMHPISYRLARRLVRVEHIALPNLVAGRRILPELVQRECRPETVAAQIGRWLDEPSEAQSVRRSLATVRERLGAPGVFDRAAEAVLAELDAARARD